MQQRMFAAATRAAAFVALVFLFTQNFQHNLFAVGRPGFFQSFQSDDNTCVSLMGKITKEKGLGSTGGFMVYNSGHFNAGKPYLSAFGLQGKVFSAFYRFSRLSLEAFTARAHLTVSLLFAAMLSAFALRVHREFGFGAAAALVVLVNCSEWVVAIARNIYWVYFLHLLPFVVSFLVFPLVLRTPGLKFRWYLAIVGATVLLKGLCYQDYISNTALSVGAAPIYYGLAARRPWREVAGWTVWSVSIAVAAVVVSILATGIQAGIWLGSADAGFQQLIGAAASRMYSGAEPARAAPPGISAFQIFERYLPLPVVSIPFSNPERYRIYLSFFAFVFALLPLGLIPLADRRFLPEVEAVRTKLGALAAATLWGLGATLSWAFLMKGHMWHHIHMNATMFYIPYLLLVFVLLGASLSLLAHRAMALLRGDDLAAAAEQPAPPPSAPRGRKQGRSGKG